MSDERDRPAASESPDGPTPDEGSTREPAPAEGAPPAPADPDPQAAAAAVEPDPGGATSPPEESIASQPETAGDPDEWRSEMADDTEGGTDPDVYGDDVYDETEYEPVEPEPEAQPDDGWDPDPRPVAGGNGAAGRYAAGRGTSPPARRRPASARPSARRPSAAGADEGEDRDENSEGALAAKQKRQVIVLSVLTILVVGIGAAGFLLSRGASETGQDAIGGGGGPTTSVRAGPTIPAADMLQIHDPVTNFNIKVPKTWQNIQPPVADIRLVMAAGEGDALSVRVLPIQTPATVENIGNFKEVTDAIVFGDRTAKLLQEQLIRVNNNLAYHYVYTFTDRTSGQEGVHAHYFIFEGNRMFSVVFQTLPTQDFVRLAPVFDQVAESISIGTAPATTTTTAAP